MSERTPRKHPVMAKVAASSLAIFMFVIIPLAALYPTFGKSLAILFAALLGCGVIALVYVGVRDWDEENFWE